MTEPAPATAAGGAPVRVGRIEFVNCFPLYHHFAAGARRARRRRRDRRGVSGGAQRHAGGRGDRRDAVVLDRLRAPRGRAGAPPAGLDQLVRRGRLHPAVRAHAAGADPPGRAHGEERDLHLPAQGALPRVGHRPRVRAAPRPALRGARGLRRAAAHRRRGAAPAARRGVSASLRPRRRVEERDRAADGLRRLRRAPRLRRGAAGGGRRRRRRAPRVARRVRGGPRRPPPPPRRSSTTSARRT